MVLFRIFANSIKGMRKVKTIFLCLISCGITGYSCQKEPIDPKVFVEQQLEGVWLINSRVNINVKNMNDTILNDTTFYSPADTVAFTTEGKYYRANMLVNFTIDAAGENITYQTPIPDVWHIDFVRNKSIGLTQTETKTIGTDTFKYYTEEVLSKK